MVCCPGEQGSPRQECHQGQLQHQDAQGHRPHLPLGRHQEVLGHGLQHHCQIVHLHLLQEVHQLEDALVVIPPVDLPVPGDGEPYIWWGFSSTSTSGPAIENFVGQAGPRVIFTVDGGSSARDIRRCDADSQSLFVT